MPGDIGRETGSNLVLSEAKTLPHCDRIGAAGRAGVWKNHGCFSEVIASIRVYLWEKGILKSSPPRGILAKLPRQLRRSLLQALAPATEARLELLFWSGFSRLKRASSLVLLQILRVESGLHSLR